MDIKQWDQHRIILVAVCSLYIWLLLAFEHLNGGVVSHHLLQREDLPAISNWWGALVVPLLSWFLSGRIYHRLKPSYPAALLAGFIAALIFAVSLSVLFEYQQHQILPYMMLSLPVLALLFPLYRPEYLLGFVLGMSYTFGALIPVLVGGVVVFMSYVLHKTLRPLLHYLWLVLTHRRQKLL